MGENQKIVNQLYLDKFRQHIEFTSQEVEVLENIATLTPYLGGDAVYSARIMIDLWPEESGVAYREDGSIQDEQINYDLKDKFKVYPNPAHIEIRGINGQLVNSYPILAGQGRVYEDLSPYSSGIYIVTLLMDNRIVESNKMVVE